MGNGSFGEAGWAKGFVILKKRKEKSPRGMEGKEGVKRETDDEC